MAAYCCQSQQRACCSMVAPRMLIPPRPGCGRGPYAKGGGPAIKILPQLTPREHDVLRLLAEGLSNSAIATRLGLSLKTVNNNTSSIFNKLNVGTRTEAAILARDRGLASTSR